MNENYILEVLYYCQECDWLPLPCVALIHSAQPAELPR